MRQILEEIPQAFAIGVGVATGIAVIFAALTLWILKREITHRRNNKTARIVAADRKSENELYSGNFFSESLELILKVFHNLWT